MAIHRGKEIVFFLLFVLYLRNRERFLVNPPDHLLKLAYILLIVSYADQFSIYLLFIFDFDFNVLFNNSR